VQPRKKRGKVIGKIKGKIGKGMTWIRMKGDRRKRAKCPLSRGGGEGGKFQGGKYTLAEFCGLI